MIPYSFENRVLSRLYFTFPLDAAEYASPSEIDGVHMSAESHKSLGLAISQKIQEIL